MDWRPCRDANICLATRLLSHLKDHKRPPLDPIRSHINPLFILTICLVYIHIGIVVHVYKFQIKMNVDRELKNIDHLFTLNPKFILTL